MVRHEDVGMALVLTGEEAQELVSEGVLHLEKTRVIKTSHGTYMMKVGTDPNSVWIAPEGEDGQLAMMAIYCEQKGT